MGGNSRGVVVDGSRSVPFRDHRSVPFRSARNQRWRRGCSRRERPLAGLHVTVFKSAFLPFHRVKMDIPKPRRILRDPASNERSRSPLSIGALRFARGDRKSVVTKFASKTCFIFIAQSRPLARLVRDDGSRKLPQNISVAEHWRCRHAAQ